MADSRGAVAAPDDLDRLISSPASLHPSVGDYHLMADIIRITLEPLVP